MSMKSIARSGAIGNTRLAKQYGAAGDPKAQSYPKGYATGGAVTSVNRDMGGPVGAEGMPAKPNLGRAGRKMKGKDGNKGTNVNVVIMQKPDGAPPMPGGPVPGPMAGPPPGGPPMPMPMPPPGAGPGGPPMPMRKAGGRVKRAWGGPVGNAAGATGATPVAPSMPQMPQTQAGSMPATSGSAFGGNATPVLPVGASPTANIAPTGINLPQPSPISYQMPTDITPSPSVFSSSMGGAPLQQASGGSASNSPTGGLGFRSGGPVMRGMNAGAGSAKGREEMAEMQKKIR